MNFLSGQLHFILSFLRFDSLISVPMKIYSMRVRIRHVVICNEGVHLAFEMNTEVQFDSNGAVTFTRSSCVHKQRYVGNC